MVEILYAIQHAFMRKTVEAIDGHVAAESAYVPLNAGARECCDAGTLHAADVSQSVVAERGDDLGSRFVVAVVHDEAFKVGVALAEDALDGVAEDRRPVVGREDDADGHRRKHGVGRERGCARGEERVVSEKTPAEGVGTNGCPARPWPTAAVVLA